MCYHEIYHELFGPGRETFDFHELSLSNVSQQPYRIPLLDLTNSHNSGAEMNWTEGALQRNSRRKGWNPGLVRQKEYFAKARTKYRQRAAADENAEGQATIFIPSYIKDQAAAGVGGSRSNDQTGLSKMRATVNDGRKRRLPSPTETGGKPSRMPPESQSRLQSVSHLIGVDGTDSRGTADLDAKRRRLLEQSDWAGINFQQTLLEDLAPATHGAIADHHNRRLGGHLVQKGENVAPLELPRDHRSTDKRSNDEMRLKIGTQNLRWSRGSNTVRSCEMDSTASPPSSTWDHWQSSLTAIGVPLDVSSKANASTLTEQRVTPSNKTKYSNSLRASIGKHAYQTKSSSVGSLEIGAPIYVINSSPLMHHPRPARCSRPPVVRLKTPDLETSPSLIARAGSAEMRSLSRNPDEDMWRQWLQTDEENEAKGIDVDCGSASPTARDAVEDNLHLPMESTSVLHTQTQLSSLQPNTRLDALASGSVGLNQQQVSLFDTFFSNTHQPNIPSLPEPMVDKQPQCQDSIFVPSENEAWQKFLMAGAIIAEGDDLGDAGWSAALEGTTQASTFSSETGASSVVETPISVEDDMPALTHDGPFSDPPSLATLTDSNDNGTASLDDWTDLAHEQACQQQASSTGVKQPLGFKFHQPEPFIGKLASKAMPRSSTFKTDTATQRKRGRGRPKKPRDARRPDIRAWPNFDDDPIDDSSSINRGGR